MFCFSTSAEICVKMLEQPNLHSGRGSQSAIYLDPQCTVVYRKSVFCCNFQFSIISYYYAPAPPHPVFFFNFSLILMSHCYCLFVPFPVPSVCPRCDSSADKLWLRYQAEHPCRDPLGKNQFHTEPIS